MQRNLIVCLDGTGNEFSDRNTNVLKLYSSIRRVGNDRQIAYYSPGVGTMGELGDPGWAARQWRRFTGLALGKGVAKNIQDAYLFLMNNFREDDRLFIFGFSRGAYAARALAGMLHKVGLLERGAPQLLPYAFKHYKKRQRSASARQVVQGFRDAFCRKCKPHFLGVWDTVTSIGWIRSRRPLDFTTYNADIRTARHALSLDERRSQYRPALWEYPNTSSIREVWFPGVHSDVGASYRESGLSDISLKWMLDAARAYGLLVDLAVYGSIHPDPLGKLHNPLVPFWWLLGWRTRRVRTFDNSPPLVHEAVRRRKEGLEGYSPPLPADVRWES